MGELEITYDSLRATTNEYKLGGLRIESRYAHKNYPPLERFDVSGVQGEDFKLFIR